MSARGGKKKITKLSRSARAGVIFPVGRMMRYLRTGTHKYRIGMGAPVYMAAVIEYLAGGNPDPPLLWNEIMFYQKKNLLLLCNHFTILHDIEYLYRVSVALMFL